LSPGFGSAITYASFIGKKEDVYKASLIVCVSNSAFSILAGFAVFSIVGSVAYENGITVEEAATEVGTGLAFFTIAEAMGLFGNAKNAMSVLFYVMLFTLGLDSSYANFETLVAFVETALHRKGYKPPLWTITLSMSVVMFLLGLIFCTRKGTQVLGMIDMYIGTMLLLFICCCEGFIFNFGMGWKRLTLALQAATIGNKGSPNGRSLFPNWLCRLDLHVTVPIGTGFLFIYQFVDLARNPYGGYPASTNGWGWALLVVGLAIAFSTIWKRGESQLPPIEDDPRFQEVLNAEGIKGEGKNDETARDGKDDAEEEFVDKEAGDLDGSETPIDVGGEAPVMEAVA
jgi:NSS family neurotransmitter:Na+ symporter